MIKGTLCLGFGIILLIAGIVLSTLFATVSMGVLAWIFWIPAGVGGILIVVGIVLMVLGK